MKIVQNTEQLLVADDVLTAKSFDNVLGYLREKEYNKLAGGERFSRVWHVDDGTFHVQDDFACYHINQITQGCDNILCLHRNGGRRSPTEAIDSCIRTLISAVLCHTGLTSLRRAGAIISARAQVYAARSALAFHDDSLYLGSYTFYAHTGWNCEFGGELLVYPREIGNQHESFQLAGFENGRLSSIVEMLGVATAIPPRPNRLVAMRPNQPHKIARIDPSAGATLRHTITGFIEYCRSCDLGSAPPQ